MNHLQQGKANIVIDGQWGSTGKGKLAGYLALRNKVDLISCDFMTNAGHTWVDDNGIEFMVQQLPSGLINMDTLLCINPGAMITLEKLLMEIETFGITKDRLFIHPMAGVIRDSDRQNESGLDRISSTKKGCGAALSAKIMRDAPTAKDYPELEQYIADTSEMAQTMLSSGGTVVIETAQGFDLSLNHGHKYPFTTSRDVTVMAALNNAGIHPNHLGNTWGSLRTHPIRVGNVYNEDGSIKGSSGPFYSDQVELSWEEMTSLSGSKDALIERTTVTKKVRRVFSFSHKQLKNFIIFNQPTHLFINFVNYWDSEVYGKADASDMTTNIVANLQDIYHTLKTTCTNRRIRMPKISLLGTGPRDSHMIELGEIYA